jgi:gliding motility-associated lipoprotein GldH
MKIKIKIAFNSILLAFLLSCTGLKHDEVRLYHSFESRSWNRFQVLTFKYPVTEPGKTFDISLFGNFSKEYEYGSLEFNMVLTSPSGEERIREYHLDVKDKNGAFLGVFKGDTCNLSVSLKKGLKISRRGMLKIEIENLIPRVETTGLFGVGIRIKPGRE